MFRLMLNGCFVRAAGLHTEVPRPRITRFYLWYTSHKRLRRWTLGF